MSIVKIIGCGGAGVNIANDSFNRLKELGDGFSGVKDFYADTSDNNTDHLNIDQTKIYRMVESNPNNENMKGSGGIRQTHSSAIGNQIKDLCKTFGFDKTETDEYYVVCFSAAGGSGSVIAPLLIKDLLQKGMRVIAVFVGDTDDAVSVENTMGTIKTLNAISKSTKTTLSCHYISNSDGQTASKSTANLKRVNGNITSFMVVLSMFLSGQNKEIDNQDMNNLLNMSVYNTWNIKPGLYALVAYSGKINKHPNTMLMMGRTLLIEGTDDNIVGDFLSYKVGVVPKQEMSDKMGSNNFPICLTTEGNYFPSIVKELGVRLDSWSKDLDEINNGLNDFGGSGGDENGLIF